MAKLQDTQFRDKGALWPFLKRIFTYSLRYKAWFRQFIIAMVVVAIADAVFPLVLLSLIDNILTPQIEAIKLAADTGQEYVINYKGVMTHGALFLIIGIFQVIGVYAFIIFAGRIREYVMFELRDEMFNKLQQLSYSFYDRSATGWLLSRLTSDTDRVTELISWGFIEAVWGIVMIIACLTAMAIYNLKLALIVAFAIPILIVVSFRIRMLILKYSRASRKINSEITASFTEHISGIELIKSTAQEDRATREFGDLSMRMQGTSYRAQYYTAMYMPLVVFIGSISAVLVVYFGGSMAIAVPAGITVGVLAASFDYATKIFMPIMDLSRFYSLAQASLSAGERIFSLIDEEPAIYNRGKALATAEIKGDIQFENVVFYYEPESPVLDGLSLHIKAGQSVAIVGPTGEGKSTLVNLIGRFYEPVAGKIFIDGQDYLDITLESLRSKMGVVLQQPHLFSGTIEENIRYGRLDATREDIEGALREIGAEGFIVRLEEEVGEEGLSLSEGERQIVSFVRAVLAEPSIFIMDEATSSVDTETEILIQQGLEKIIKGRTSIIIAHRLSTIRNCDRILVMGKGKIREDGSHKELMASKGAYYRLYTHQLREEKTLEMLNSE